MIAETVCSAVSAAGLGIAGVTAYRKRFLSATRIAAYSLVPVGLVLTGVVSWVAGIVFKPSVWLGFALLGVAWLFFASTRAVERRSGSTREERKAAKEAQREAAAPAAHVPTLPTRAKALQAQSPQQAQSQPEKRAEPGAAAAEDFSDVEAILKKHGI
jgi:hypothetical protein